MRDADFSDRANGCVLCPRRCGADRERTRGRCGAGKHARVARAALHHWEEPGLSGTAGSGTVFFSGCPLGCCYCQNYHISAENFGKNITDERLAEIFCTLQAEGAHNLNLVSPTPYVPQILRALERARPTLHIPVVYNSSGYETVETLRLLEGAVDVYLPDLKYSAPARAQRYSDAADYFDVASAAILEMFRQTGGVRFAANGLLLSGTVIRHLVLPKGVSDSLRVLDWIAENLPHEDVLLSLMSQYTPSHQSAQFPELNRRISTYEYNRVLAYARERGLRGYMQERSSAREEYTPPFNLEGV